MTAAGSWGGRRVGAGGHQESSGRVPARCQWGWEVAWTFRNSLEALAPSSPVAPPQPSLLRAPSLQSHPTLPFTHLSSSPYTSLMPQCCSWAIGQRKGLDLRGSWQEMGRVIKGKDIARPPESCWYFREMTYGAGAVQPATGNHCPGQHFPPSRRSLVPMSTQPLETIPKSWVQDWACKWCPTKAPLLLPSRT